MLTPGVLGAVDHAYGVNLTNALRRLSVAMCKGHAYVLRMGPQSLAGIAGTAVVRARAQPTRLVVP